MIYTSNNLDSSAKWLKDYINAFDLPVAQCGHDSLFTTGKMCNLEESMKYRFRTGDLGIIRQDIKQKKHLAAQMKKIDDRLKKISKDHYYAHLATM